MISCGVVFDDKDWRLALVHFAKCITSDRAVRKKSLKFKGVTLEYNGALCFFDARGQFINDLGKPLEVHLKTRLRTVRPTPERFLEDALRFTHGDDFDEWFLVFSERRLLLSKKRTGPASTLGVLTLW